MVRTCGAKGTSASTMVPTKVRSLWVPTSTVSPASSRCEVCVEAGKGVGGRGTGRGVGVSGKRVRGRGVARGVLLGLAVAVAVAVAAVQHLVDGPRERQAGEHDRQG